MKSTPRGAAACAEVTLPAKVATRSAHDGSGALPRMESRRESVAHAAYSDATGVLIHAEPGKEAASSPCHSCTSNHECVFSLKEKKKERN